MADTIVLRGSPVATELSVATSQTVALAVAAATASSPGSSASIIWNEVPSGTMNGSNATFTLAQAPDATKIILSLNGLILRPGASHDYTVSGSTVTLTAQAVKPESGDSLLATYAY